MNPCALSCQQAGMRGGVKERMKSDGEEEVYSANLGDLRWTSGGHSEPT